MSGYRAEMRAPQSRQRARSTSHDTKGMLSYQRIAWPHAPHVLAGRNTERPRGTRWMTTFRNDPMLEPNAPKASVAAVRYPAMLRWERICRSPPVAEGPG